MLKINLKSAQLVMTHSRHREIRGINGELAAIQLEIELVVAPRVTRSRDRKKRLPLLHDLVLQNRVARDDASTNLETFFREHFPCVSRPRDGWNAWLQRWRAMERFLDGWGVEAKNAPECGAGGGIRGVEGAAYGS